MYTEWVILVISLFETDSEMVKRQNSYEKLDDEQIPVDYQQLEIARLKESQGVYNDSDKGLVDCFFRFRYPFSIINH